MTLLYVAAFLLVATSASAASQLIETRAQALAYIDTTFSNHNCTMRRSAFFTQMERDGVAPTVDDMSRPTDGSLKIIRQRRVLSALHALFQTGAIKEDKTDKTIAISQFGGCA